MPNIDLDKAITALDRVTAVRNENNQVVNVRMIVISSLLAKRPESLAQKLEDADLAEKIHGTKGAVDFTVEELSRIKQLIGDAQAPLVAKRCCNLLDPRTEAQCEEE